MGIQRTSSTGLSLNGASLLALLNPYSKLGEVLGASLNRPLYILDLIYRAYVTYFRPEGISTRRRYLSAFTIGMGHPCTSSPRRRDHIDSLLLYSDRTHRAQVFMHFYRHRPTRLQCCQCEDY